MAAISPSWTTKTVKITYRNPLTKIKEAGSWIVETTGRVTNTLTDGTKQVFRPGRFDQGNLNIVDGVPSLIVDIPVIDDPDNTPQGGAVRLTVSFASGGAETFTLFPLTSWVSVTDIGDLLDPTITPGVATYVVKGVPGGVAALNADGNVIDAFGNIVAGGGGGGTISPEIVQDIVASTLVAGANTSIVYDDAANTITISSTGTGGGSGTSYTDEQVRDVIGAALRSTGYISLTVDDANDTITFGHTTALDNAFSNRVSVAGAQTFTTAQKVQALSNLGVTSTGKGVTTVIVPQSDWATTDRSAALDFGQWRGDAGSSAQPPSSKMGIYDVFWATPA